MSDISVVTTLLREHTPAVAMVAPSFPVMYAYPAIVGKLRRLGFDKVVEVSAGAARTNAALVEAYKKDPAARFITSPCPTFVRLIRSRYPQYRKYLALSVDSPMAATARMMKETYPEHLIVFIGPCVAKKMEAKEDYPDLAITVLTYTELEGLFTIFGITDSADDQSARFDLEEKKTRMYPTDGGLTDSSGIRTMLTDEEIRIVSGLHNVEKALAEFDTNPSIRLLDVLFCDGGCVSGPGVKSDLPLEERIARIQAYASR